MNSHPSKYKICIVSNQLAGGGAERCSALLSQFLQKNNCDVYHVIVIDKIEYQFSGEILNLGKLKKEGFNFRDRVDRFIKLFLFFRANKFDYIIDTRVKSPWWQELIITKLVYNSPLILVVHSFITELYFPKSTFIAKNIYRNALKLISVSDLISKKVKNKYKFEQTQTIYNPIDFELINCELEETIESNIKYVLAVGNMHIDVKQFDQLILAYSKTILINRNIKLMIIGEGKLLTNYLELTNSLNLQDYVIFKGKITNVFPYYKNALFTVLSSKNEGFPMVLLESLACDTPVVSFACASGPSEIILDKVNGILVEDQNFEKLTEAMNLFIQDSVLIRNCKQNAKSSVEKFSIERIGKQWLNLMNIEQINKK